MVISLKEKKIKSMDRDPGKGWFNHGRVSGGWYDGRMASAAFDGHTYVVEGKEGSVVLCRYDHEGNRMVLAAIGNEGWQGSSSRRCDDTVEIIAFGEAVLAELRFGEVWLYYKGQWKMVFKRNSSSRW